VTKTMRQILIAAALSMTWASDASAMNGDGLRKMCDPILYVDINKDVLTHKAWGDLNLCFGYIDGASDGMWQGLRHFCTPSGVTYPIMTKVVVVYLDRHPERLHLGAQLLIDEAFTQAYPCPAKPKNDGDW
jgi:hypothetical protein